MAKAITIFTTEYNSEAIEAATEMLLEFGNETGRNFNEDPITDEEISQYLTIEQDHEWAQVGAELDDLFYGYKVLMTGTVGRWDGRFLGGKVGSFEDLFNDLVAECDAITITDEHGRLYIRGVHHDGHMDMEVRLLTEAGENAWHDWEYNRRFSDLDEREMHERLYKSRRYTEAPRFVKNVWGAR